MDNPRSEPLDTVHGLNLSVTVKVTYNPSSWYSSSIETQKSLSVGIETEENSEVTEENPKIFRGSVKDSITPRSIMERSMNNSPPSASRAPAV